MTNNQILKDIQKDIQFIKDNTATKFDGLNETVEFIKDNAVTKKEFDELKTKVGQMQADMVTRDYLDKKFLRYADKITESSKDGNIKLTTLVEILHDKKVLTTGENKKILSLKPFPQLAV